MADHDLKLSRSAAEPEPSLQPAFVGRESELAELRALYDRAVLERGGRLALVTGPSGVGKSRLVSELARRVRASGVPVLEGTCRDGGVAYQPFIELAGSALSLLSDQGPAHGSGGDRVARAAEVAAALRGQGFFGAGAPGRRSRGQTAPLGLVRDGRDHRMQFFERVAQLFLDVARLRPPLVLVHDVHLADGASVQLLAYLLRTLAPAPGFGGDDGWCGLIVATQLEGDVGGARPPAWMGDAPAHVISLDGLDDAGIRAFLSSPALLAKLREASGGVPRRLEALLERRPPDADDLVAERLAELSPPCARLLRALALYGRPAGAALIERLASELAAEDGPDAAELDAQELRSSRLLTRSVVGGELRLGFASSGDRAAMLRGLSHTESVALHRAIGDALLPGLESGEDPASCAEHLLEGQAGERSVDVALTAGETLERAFAYERAISVYERALTATSRPEVRAVLEERLADLFELTGDYARALAVVERMAERSPDATALGRAGHLALLRGDFPAAQRALGEARVLAEQGDDVGVHVQVLADLAECHFLAGAHDTALAVGSAALDLPAPLGAARGRFAARNTIGKVYLEKGAYDRAAAYFTENLGESEGLGILRESARAHNNLGICALRRDDYESAEVHYRKGLAAAREHGDVRLRAFCLQNLGVLAQWRRDYTAALRYYQDAVEAFKRLGHRPWLAWVALDLGDLYLGLGDASRATAMADLAGRIGADVATTAVILENLRGRIALDRGDVATARAHLERSLETVTRLDYKDEHSLTLLYLARLELHVADPQAALARLAAIPMPACARTMAQLLALRGEARLALGEHDAARVDLVAADRAFADLRDDEGRLRAVLATIALCEAIDDSRGARAARQQARDLDAQLRARVPAEFSGSYGRDPQRLALQGEPPLRGPRAVVRAAAAVVPAATPPRPPRGDRFPNIVGKSPEIAHVLEMIERVAPHDSLVLVRGESGTGKELVAEAIHEGSRRRGRPFVKVNCGALVESLLLSELFGHERGAFTGALSRRKGRFELADGGTLFLDEIGDISPQTQVALLRVLQTHEFERVGGTQPVRVDVRIVCATNRDLEEMVAGGRFREDLYYRLKGIEIDLPALRARAADIPELVRHFLSRIADERQTTPRRVSPAALEALTRYPWPGNIRELENVIRSVTLFADGEEIDVRDLVEYIGAPRTVEPPRLVAPARRLVDSQPLAPVAPAPPPPAAQPAAADVYGWAVENKVPLRELKRRIERDCIAQALAECSGNITRAAERLGMKRPRLSQLLKEHGISPTTRDGRPVSPVTEELQ